MPRETKVGRDGDELDDPHEYPVPDRLGPVGQFVEHDFHHFNSATVKEACRAYVQFLDQGGQMFLAMAGAMSTGELGISLAEMIRQGKISGISCTGANLEEDVFNLVGYDHYERFSDYDEMTPEEDEALADRGVMRITDTGVTEEAMKLVEDLVFPEWQAAHDSGTPEFIHEILFKILRSGKLAPHYEADPENSWMLAAAEADLPVFVPGEEDSTLGQVFIAQCLEGTFKTTDMKNGFDYGVALGDWYLETTKASDLGFFQIGGGIAGDFSICIAPVLRLDLKLKQTRKWQYFCQINDGHDSCGGYSAAKPTEKRSWTKLPADCPAFNLFGDASYLAPLVFRYVLGH